MAWEAALANVVSPGDHVLMYETGHFAALWTKLAKRLGLNPPVMLRKVGLTPRMLASPTQLIPLESALRIRTGEKDSDAI